MSVSKTIIFYECFFTFFCVLLSLILFSIIFYYGKLKNLRSQMKLKFVILFISFVFELPYYIYLLPKDFDDTLMYSLYIYWLGLLKLLSFCLVPTAVIFLVMDRILIIMYPANTNIQRSLLQSSIIVMLCQTVLFVCLSIWLEKPVEELTSKYVVLFYRQIAIKFLKIFVAACRTVTCVMRDKSKLFSIARLIVGAISLTSSSTFLFLFVHRRKTSTQSNNKDKHQSSVVIVVTAIAADLLFGFIPCGFYYLLIIEESALATVIGPSLGVLYTFERMVMLTSYLFILKKRSASISSNNVVKSTSNEQT